MLKIHPRVFSTQRQLRVLDFDPRVLEFETRLFKTKRQQAASAGIRSASVQNGAAAGRECWNSITEYSKLSDRRPRMLESDP